MSKTKQRTKAAKKVAPKKAPRISDEGNGKTTELLDDREAARSKAREEVPAQPVVTPEQQQEDFMRRYKACHAIIKEALREHNFRIDVELTYMVWVGGKSTGQIACQWGLKPNELE